MVRNSMIDKQKAIIHGLILDEEDNLFILRNEHNLTRLESMKQFPLPTLIRFSALIPLFGFFLGYLVGIAFLL